MAVHCWSRERWWPNAQNEVVTSSIWGELKEFPIELVFSIKVRVPPSHVRRVVPSLVPKI